MGHLKWKFLITFLENQANADLAHMTIILGFVRFVSFASVKLSYDPFHVTSKQLKNVLSFKPQPSTVGAAP